MEMNCVLNDKMMINIKGVSRLSGMQGVQSGCAVVCKLAEYFPHKS